MQTPAERYLITQCIYFLKEQKNCVTTTPLMLNVGAGRSVVIENQIDQEKIEYFCDRIDIENCSINHSKVKNCWHSSVESMPFVAEDRYILVVANFVFEHVSNLEMAAREIYRVLKPGGRFITTLPNPKAPEMMISKYTPLWFHRLIRGGDGWETQYNYKDISSFIETYEMCGFRSVETNCYSFIQGYLQFPIISKMGRLYDKIITVTKIKGLMNQACIVLEKPIKRGGPSL
ncbi:MAG: class I SAM-dependent methyltransferase [Proteobacteria bacterium]|nr:class I SAM-dependent methyltransferase [Pseudomonadota bacterium]